MEKELKFIDSDELIKIMKSLIDSVDFPDVGEIPEDCEYLHEEV